MKSELTLHLDENLKEQIEHIARQRGTSVSELVEGYFRLLRDRSFEKNADAEELGDEAPGDEATSEETVAPHDFSSVPDDLPPRTRRMLDEITPAGSPLDLDEDTRTWIDAAHRKHE
jgi:predicted transcriptional regulator